MVSFCSRHAWSLQMSWPWPYLTSLLFFSLHSTCTSLFSSALLPPFCFLHHSLFFKDSITVSHREYKRQREIAKGQTKYIFFLLICTQTVADLQGCRLKVLTYPSLICLWPLHHIALVHNKEIKTQAMASEFMSHSVLLKHSRLVLSIC